MFLKIHMFMNTANFTGFGLDQWKPNPDADFTEMFCGAVKFDVIYILSWNTTEDIFCDV